MKLAPRPVSRLTACLAALGASLSLSSVALAQTPGPVPPPAAPTAPAPAAAPLPPPPAYQDQYIAGGTLSPDISLGETVTSDTSGLARAIRVDGVVSMLSQSGPNAPPTVHENGVIVNSQFDTAYYGAWSVDAAARIGGSGSEGPANPYLSTGDTYGDPAFSIHERGMAFDGGWQTDNSLGDIYAPLINLTHQEARFLLPAAPMEGVETEWRGPSSLQLVAGVGEPGVFDGIRVPTFQTLGGTTATAGAQWSPAPQFALGGQFAAARDVNLYYESLDTDTIITAPHFSSDTALLTGAWQGSASRAQLNLIEGSIDGSGSELGVWADASTTHGGFTNSAGAFRIDPNLAWGDQVMINDVQGGYYRLGYQSRRWVADIGVDEVDSVTPNGVNSTFLNGDARYQLSRDLGMGVVGNILHTGGTNAWSAEGYLDRVNAFGTGRLQLDYATDPQTTDVSVTLQQTWSLQAGTHLSTSAAVDRLTGSPNAPLTFTTAPTSTVTTPTTTTTPIEFATPTVDQNSTVLRLAAYGGTYITSRVSLDGTIQWATAIQGAAAPSTSANISLDWQVTNNWSALLSYYENRVGSWTPLVINSPLSPQTPTVIAASGERGVFLTVRWQEARGAHFAPLGGMPGAGAGRLTGVVYLDANENGRFDAGEAGVPNVTVILDGRFSVRTDANGRFDFSAVAAGHHVLTVQSDNLPLPWTIANDGRTDVEVGTRDRVDVNIGAVRIH